MNIRDKVISVCIIARNEREILANAVKSTVGLADEVILVDTGSTDGTVELAKSLGCVLAGSADRMHKANARNQAIEAAEGDWVVVLDADERIADPTGLREHLENTDAQAVYVRLAFVDGNGNFTLSYQQMRCWRKDSFRYKYRAHEVPIPTDGWGKIEHTEFVWEHRPPRGRSWKLQYTLDRLLLDVEENPGVARPLYYLGRQYMYCKKYEKAIESLNKYLELRRGSDQADAWRCLAICYKNLGDRDKQVQSLHRACAEHPDRREFWGELAEIYHAEGKEEIAAGLIKCLLEIPMPAKSYTTHRWYGPHPYDLLGRCLWKLGRYEEGRKWALKALSLSPKDKRLRDNLQWFENKLQPTRIFITGCAKSGTTLLKRLFHAFSNVHILSDEVHIRQFVRHKSPTTFLIGKRHRYSLFSEHLTDSAWKEQMELVRQHNIKIVNIIRDGRDVIHSSEGYVPPRRWVEAMRQRDDSIAVEVRYEDVVTDPDRVQKKIADKLGLDIVYKWSEYPNFVPDAEFAHSIYTKKPLNRGSVGVGGSYQNTIDNIMGGFEKELTRAGYAKGPEYYDKLYSGCKKRPYQELTKLAAGYIVGKSVLDLGCGAGQLTRYLNGHDYLGVDFSTVAIDIAKERFPSYVFNVGDIRNLAINEDFDTVTLIEILEHLDNPIVAINVAQSRAERRIIVTVPVDMPDTAHVKPTWEKEDIEALLGELSFCEKVLDDMYWLAVKDV